MLQNYLNYSPIQEKKCFPLSSFSNLDQKRMENHDGAKLPQNAPLNDSTHVSPILTGWCLGVNMYVKEIYFFNIKNSVIKLYVSINSKQYLLSINFLPSQGI